MGMKAARRATKSTYAPLTATSVTVPREAIPGKAVARMPPRLMASTATIMTPPRADPGPRAMRSLLVFGSVPRTRFQETDLCRFRRGPVIKGMRGLACGERSGNAHLPLQSRGTFRLHGPAGSVAGAAAGIT
jgi:hypothetical protein